MHMLLMQLVDTLKVDSCNVLALTYSPELNSVVAASASGAIHLIALDRSARCDETSDEPLPDTLLGHTQAVTALALLPDYVLLSGGFDATLRFWDLHTMHELEGARKVCPAPCCDTLFFGASVSSSAFSCT